MKVAMGSNIPYKFFLQVLFRYFTSIISTEFDRIQVAMGSKLPREFFISVNIILTKRNLDTDLIDTRKRG